MLREQFISNVEGCQEALRRFLTALCCGDTQLADDLAQDALLKAYMSYEGLNEAGKFKSWIFTIAYNTFVSSCRSQRQTTGYEAVADMSSAGRSDDAFKYQGLYAALDLLPEKERSSILLFYLEGYSIKEIAEITGSKDDAVRQQLSRGRSHLRVFLNDCSHE